MRQVRYHSLCEATIIERALEKEKHLHALRTTRNECILRLQLLAAQKTAGKFFEEDDW